MAVKNSKSTLFQCFVCLGIGLSLTFLILLVQGIFNVEEKTAREFMRVFHNAFFVAGALESVFAGFAFVAGKGAFLGIGYALGTNVTYYAVENEDDEDCMDIYSAKSKTKFKCIIECAQSAIMH